ncbi:hypothetical protein [Amycolatopsis sp. CA-230715]|uniref:hypothetical protein n=1 Tax=Amycolatopsis sp. CA-230715 TaxID=2745196 RepID=UPI0020B28D6B|nr:hypothetical protein [Amycolatopsis sp. CA-230715]
MAVLALVLTGCGAGAGGEHACTLIAAVVGISVDLAPPIAEKTASATVEACWANTCRTHPLDLAPASKAGPQTCTGTGPDAACSAQSIPTGGKHGVVTVPDLPETPVQVTVTLTEPGGRTGTKKLTATPVMAHPNGPDCGGGGPQLNLAVDASGTLVTR